MGLQPGGPGQPPAGGLRAASADAPGPASRAAESAGGDLRELARDLVAAKEDGRIKLYVTYQDARNAAATTPGS